MTVSIIDATLREGAQAPGVRFSSEDSVAIAEALVACGVEMIEVGHPSASQLERARVSAVAASGLGRPVLAHARARPADVEAVADCGADWVGIFLGVNEMTRRVRLGSTQEASALLEMVDRAIARAKSLGLRVRYTVEDASRTAVAQLLRACARAIDAGADRICFADSVGTLEPTEVASMVAHLRETFAAEAIEVHLHDDRGLALASALAAVDAGAGWISASVNGVGERCGITETCALIANLHARGARALPPAGTLPRVADLVDRATGIPRSRLAPVVGEHAFTHTAPLHIRAVERDEEAYSWLSPSRLGRQTRIASRATGLPNTDAAKEREPVS